MSARGWPLVAVAAVASAALAFTYLAAGGGTYEPTPVADPCEAREWRDPDGLEQAAQQFALSALDGAACELGVAREELAVALVDEESRADFAEEQGIDEEELETAVRAGLVRAIDDAEAAGALGGVVADGLRAVATRIPVDEAIGLIEDAEVIFGDAQGLLDGLLGDAGGLLDQAEGLLP